MGKHDKKSSFEWVEPQTLEKTIKEAKANMRIISYDPPSDEFYKERIKTLEQEIARLKEELIDTQHNLAVMTSLYEQGAESIQRNEARSDEIIERKNEEIEMAKEAIYLAAMREVALR